MGCIWELDGLREGPVRHGACGEGERWVDAATEVIRERIGTYPEGSVRCSHPTSYKTSDRLGTNETTTL
jgi:hypothetical protein